MIGKERKAISVRSFRFRKIIMLGICLNDRFI